MALKGISLPAILIGGGGLLFLWSGLHGASVTGSLRDVIAGRQPSGANVNPISGGAGSGPGPGGSVSPVGGSVASPANRSLGRMLAASRGWTGSQWTALDNIWTRESGWSNTAKNPSGAYGIPQALPETKMPFAAQSAGGSNPRAQIEWGLSYIAQRYGDPVKAWAFWQANGWY